MNLIGFFECRAELHSAGLMHVPEALPAVHRGLAPQSGSGECRDQLSEKQVGRDRQRGTRACGSEAPREDLQKYGHERLGGTTAPKSVEFWGELPHTAVGKTSKREICDRFWQGLLRQN
ncbi:long-chain fatty acid--CoA ligase [Ramlibacter sp. 2FC]|uniref:long-chain fatty acid--CoA ligase n=1 Tax=Ramlibacter sp. 2FC TaxID=2502188 RepID=UPI0010F85D7A|nr:long-chain fatty acid--CoA ligase [Ramlibacter sp. 2FC]